MKKQFLECGKIVTTHGIKGEVRVEPWCDSPVELISIPIFYSNNGENPMMIEKSRVHKNMVIVKFAGVDTIEEAVKLRGRVIFLNRDDAPPDDGEYFVQDLIDCHVYDVDSGKDYGKIYDVRPTGSNDVYYLRDEKGVERLVPVIPQVVVERDIDAGIIKIRPLEGLFDDD